MEPMNATAHLTADACTVWAPTQNPGGSREIAAQLTGLPVERVTVNTTFLGGGFGRRGQIGLRRGCGRGRQGDRRRAGEGHLDARGRPHAQLLPSEHVQRVPGGARRRRQADRVVHARGRGRAPPPAGQVPAGQVDNTSMAGLRDLPYDIPNVRIEWVDQDVGVPIGFWRSVGSSQNAFIVETFIDELAHQAGQDPYEYRRALLGKSPRHKASPRAGGDQGGLGHAAAGGTRARHRGVLLLRELLGARGRGLGRRRRRGTDPPPRLRDRLRDRGQPGPGQGADGGRRGLRDDRDALRPDHARRRPRPADELPHLPDDADRRDPRHRGAHPGLGPAAGRAWESRACPRSRRPSATRSSPRRASASGACRSIGRRSSARSPRHLPESGETRLEKTGSPAPACLPRPCSATRPPASGSAPALTGLPGRAPRGPARPSRGRPGRRRRPPHGQRPPARRHRGRGTARGGTPDAPRPGTPCPPPPARRS